MTSKMTPTEFAQIEGSIRGTRIQGLVNVNTASVTVLACLPGMDINSGDSIGELSPNRPSRSQQQKLHHLGDQRDN